MKVDGLMYLETMINARKQQWALWQSVKRRESTVAAHLGDDRMEYKNKYGITTKLYFVIGDHTPNT